MTARSAGAAGFYLVAIIVAELITVLISPLLGMGLHGLLLGVLIICAARLWNAPLHYLMLALALAPLIRIVSLGLPLSQFQRPVWYLLTSLPLLAATIMTMHALHLDWSDVNCEPGKPAVQLLGIPAGLVLGYAQYHIQGAGASVMGGSWLAMCVANLILLICTGGVEELIFRGVLQRSAMIVLGRWGIIYVAILFAGLHLGNLSLLNVLFAFVVGLAFGWVADRTGSLTGVAFAHGVMNIAVFVWLPSILV